MKQGTNAVAEGYLRGFERDMPFLKRSNFMFKGLLYTARFIDGELVRFLRHFDYSDTIGVGE
jgi:hypothetical protein